MTRTRLLLESLVYHGRSHLAVGLGAAVGAAVLAGTSWLVIHCAAACANGPTVNSMAPLMRSSAADSFAHNWQTNYRAESVQSFYSRAPRRQAIFESAESQSLAVDDRFGLGEFTPTGQSATVSATLAQRLELKSGTPIRITVQKSSAAPRSSAFAKRDSDSTTRALAVTADHILPPGHLVGDFTLAPGPSAPLNLIVPLRLVQQEIEQPERVNCLLSPPQPLQPLQAELDRRLMLDDWGLKVAVAPARNAYISVESRRLILEPAAVEAAQKVAEEKGCLFAPTFVYLANSIAAKGKEIPYSIVAGIDPATPAGPLNPVGVPFADDEIVLVDWKQSPLKVKPGDPITLKYYKPETEQGLEEVSQTFKLKAIIPLEGAAADPNLVPEVPGLTDPMIRGGQAVERTRMTDWDLPFEIKRGAILTRDDQYWQRYKTTPKAYITLATARKLWSTRFGDTTSMRLVPKDGTPAAALPGIRDSMLQHLDPKRGGFAFDPVARAPAQCRPRQHRLRHVVSRVQFLPDRRGADAGWPAVPAQPRSSRPRSWLAAGDGVSTQEHSPDAVARRTHHRDRRQRHRLVGGTRLRRGHALFACEIVAHAGRRVVSHLACHIHKSGHRLRGFRNDE